MKNLLTIALLILGVIVPVHAQQNTDLTALEAGARAGAIVGKAAAQKPTAQKPAAKQPVKTEEQLREERQNKLRTQSAEVKHVQNALEHPGKNNQYNLAIQANPEDTRKLTMSGTEYREINSGTTTGNNPIAYRTYENPDTKDQIRIAQVPKGATGNAIWSSVNGNKSNLKGGYTLISKMPVAGKNNEWIISSSDNAGHYRVERYTKNADGSISIVTAERKTSDWNRDALSRGTFQSVKNANVAALTRGLNGKTPTCTYGSDCY